MCGFGGKTSRKETTRKMWAYVDGILTFYRIPLPIGNVCICVSHTNYSEMGTGLSCSKDR
jgi:hypothetical protein